MIYFTSAVAAIFSLDGGRGGGARRIKNALNLVYFMMSKFLGYRKKIHYVKSQKRSIKWTYRGSGCKLIAVCTYMDFLFLIENENLLSSQHCTHFILPSEFWIFIHNDRNRPILDIYENEIIRVRIIIFRIL